MNVEAISHNALRVWQIMNDGTTWCYNKLRQVSQLSDREINAAIGWLAREDTVEIILDPESSEESYRIRHFWDMGGF
jgi:hypothetical protein